jgi:hypothetical protein
LWTESFDDLRAGFFVVVAAPASEDVSKRPSAIESGFEIVIGPKFPLSAALPQGESAAEWTFEGEEAPISLESEA